MVVRQTTTLVRVSCKIPRPGAPYKVERGKQTTLSF